MAIDTKYLTEKLVPEYIRNLKIYQAGKPISELAREKGLTKISKLASNENPLGPSPYAIKAMTNGLWDLHRYPDMHAFNLKNALSKKYGLKHENIILGNGSEGIMAYIARAFLGVGVEVLTSQASFIGFYIIAKSVGATIKAMPLNEKHQYDIDAIIKNISDKTKVIYIANPNNPTGSYITKADFDRLMEHVPNHVLVILDEAYFEFAEDKEDYPDSMNYRYDNVITLRTFSKAYGLSGIRVGYGFGHHDLIGQLTKVKLPFEPNLIAQLGAIGAIEDKPHLDRTLENNSKRYLEASTFLDEHKMNYVKSVTNFIAIETPSEDAANFLFENLLSYGVILRPLKANGLPNFIRLSLGTNDEMNHFYESFKMIITKYNEKFRS